MFRFQYLRSALRDIKRAKPKSDALVFLGDNTMNGQLTEYAMLYSILMANRPAKNILVAMGNHDVNPSSNTIEQAVFKHDLFYNALTWSRNDRPYYYRVINGYYFIVLGSEDESYGTQAYISPAQIEWLRLTMAQAGQGGKPVFIFNHQPFRDKIHFEDPYPNRDDGHYWYSLSGMGGADDEVFDIIKQYDNVFFFYGHVHADFGACETEGVTLVNVWPFTAFAGGHGMYTEVYEDRVVLRSRQFAFGQWDEGYACTVQLK